MDRPRPLIQELALRIFGRPEQPAYSAFARRHNRKPRLCRVRLHQLFVVLENHLR